MFSAGALTFREFVMHEPLPLATIQHAVLEFLRGRDDAVVLNVWKELVAQEIRPADDEEF